jgi:DNA-binding MarR family transcriptional regulator
MKREMSKVLSEFSLTVEQWSIMSVLWYSDKALKQSDLVKYTLKDKFSTSKIIGRLEKYGWVVKEPDPDDSRVTLIVKTEKSLDVQDKIQLAVRKHFDTVLAELGPDDKGALIAMLNNLRRILGES